MGNKIMTRADLKVAIEFQVLNGKIGKVGWDIINEYLDGKMASEQDAVYVFKSIFYAKDVHKMLKLANKVRVSEQTMVNVEVNFEGKSYQIQMEADNRGLVERLDEVIKRRDNGGFGRTQFYLFFINTVSNYISDSKTNENDVWTFVEKHYGFGL